jgi:hypothetical protein
MFHLRVKSSLNERKEHSQEGDPAVIMAGEYIKRVLGDLHKRGSSMFVRNFSKSVGGQEKVQDKNERLMMESGLGKNSPLSK